MVGMTPGTLPILAAESAINPVTLFIIVGGGIAFLFVSFFVVSFGSLWLKAWLSNCYVSPLNLIGMKLRGVQPTVIVDSRIMAVKSGLKVDFDMLETHYLARGNVLAVTRALIAASKAGIPLTWERACAIDLAGRDVLDAVKTCVNPKVIDCPDPRKGRTTVDAVAQDGIQLKARARVTVRTNIDRLVGGATEETINARVGEGIVTTIGSAESHKRVLENPDLISKKVLERGLDAGTAFEILSIDIADIDVGDNIGAKLQTDQAVADKDVAQAKAEERRAMAKAREAEMVAQVAENRAKVVLAEAEVPKALAQALREGNLGVMDYYGLRNIQADTRMRQAIAGDAPQQGGKTPDVL